MRIFDVLQNTSVFASVLVVSSLVLVSVLGRMYILLICFVFSRFLQQKEQIRGKSWAGESLARKPRSRELKRSEKYIPGASRRPAWALKHFQAPRMNLTSRIEDI